MFQRSIMTKAQQVMILQYMESHPDLFRGKISREFTAEQKKDLWEELTHILNAQGSCVKTTEKWRRTWIDWKCAVKKKAAEIAASEKQTGGRPACYKELSDCEMRIVNLMKNTAHVGFEADPASDEETAYKEVLNAATVSRHTYLSMEERKFVTEPICSTIQISQIYSCGNPIRDEPPQKNLIPVTEVALTNILEAQVKVEQIGTLSENSENMTHSVTNGNMIGDEPPQKNLKPASEVALTNILEAQVKMEQVNTLNKNLVKTTHVLTNSSPIREQPPQKSLKPAPGVTLTNVLEAQVEMEQINTLNENLEQRTPAVTNGSLIGEQSSRKNFKPVSEVAVANVMEAQVEVEQIHALNGNLEKKMGAVKNGSLIRNEPPRKKLKPSSVGALRNILEAQTKMEKQIDTLNENLEKMTHALTGLTKAITNSCHIIFAALDRNYTNHNKN